jgi:hypothetical protein
MVKNHKKLLFLSILFIFFMSFSIKEGKSMGYSNTYTILRPDDYYYSISQDASFNDVIVASFHANDSIDLYILYNLGMQELNIDNKISSVTNLGIYLQYQNSENLDIYSTVQTSNKYTLVLVNDNLEGDVKINIASFTVVKSNAITYSIISGIVGIFLGLGIGILIMKKKNPY